LKQTRTFLSTAFIALFFLFVPLTVLIGFYLYAAHGHFDQTLGISIFTVGFGYFSVFWHYFPSRYFEVLIYSFLVFIAASSLYVFFNNLGVRNSGGGIDTFVFVPWFSLPLATMLYFPFKVSFDKNIESNPLTGKEDGYYSDQIWIRYLQVHYDLPTFKPKAVLLGIYQVLYIVPMFISPLWAWEKDITIF
jgi:hypothetical protein